MYQIVYVSIFQGKKFEKGKVRNKAKNVEQMMDIYSKAWIGGES